MPAASYLLGEGARIDALDSESMSALFVALKGGFWSISVMLVELGADMSAVLPGNHTPLQIFMDLNGNNEID